MKQTEPKSQFVVCVKNEGYAASLELRKIYEAVLDARDVEHRLIRVIDESGEGYLYPVDYFVPIELPEAAESAFSPMSARTLA